MRRLVSGCFAVVALVIAALGATAALASAAGDGTHSTAAAKGALVSLRKTGLGAILVDARGRTLYLFEKDRNGMSACSGACLQYWPRVTSTARPRAGKGVRTSLLRVVRQHDGTRQVTYAGHPLYRFAGDTKPGQTNGQGMDAFGAEWYAVSAAGKTVE